MATRQRFGLADGLERLQYTVKDKVALIYEDKEETFGDLWNQTKLLSSAFQNELGLKVGDLVSVASPNCLEFVHCLTSLDRVGAVCLPIPHMLTSEELEIVLNEFQPKVLFLHGSQIEKFQKVQPNLSYKPRVFCFSGPESFEQYSNLLKTGNPEEFIKHEVNEEDLQLVLLTSGTTGHPKGVMKNYRNMFDASTLMGEKVANMMHSVILYNSLAWIGGNAMIWGSCLYGATVILMDGYDKDEYIHLLIKHKVPAGFLLPQPFFDFSQLPDETVKKLCENMKALMFGGGTISPTAIETALQKFPGVIFTNSYGMTEGGFVSGIFHTSLNLAPENRHLLTSVGKLNFGVHVLISDEDGTELPVGESGEISIRSSSVMPGYYKNPEATYKAFRNGWFRTGDVGMLDKEGNLYIQDRIKDVVKTPEGYNIYPIEIETILDKREDIATSTVIGIPKADGNGEVLVACLVKNGEKEQTSEDLAKYCAEHVAMYKVPSFFVYFDEFTFNRNNKVDKRKMSAHVLETGKVVV